MLMGISDLAPGSLLWMRLAAEAIDTVDRALELDPSDIQAIEIKAVVILSGFCRETRSRSVIQP